MQVIIEQAWRDAINTELKTRGMTRAEYARSLAVSTAYVSGYLNGRRSPGAEVMERWLKALDLEPVITFRRTESKASA